jgi:F-type H+-transporting ATPase subunit a
MSVVLAAINPMEQFLVHRLVPISVAVPGVGPVDLSITNSVLFMAIAATLIGSIFVAGAQNRIVPGRLQSAVESFYDVVDGSMVGAMIGDNGRPFLPYIFTLFTFIAMMNVIGLIPGSFTVTSQLAVTATLAAFSIGLVLIVGFGRHGLGFFKLFVPSGVHWAMAIFLVPIELISFSVRPFTLALRLFGNMLAGHVMVYLFASFVIGLGVFAAAHGGISNLLYVGSAASLAMVVALFLLELVVAVVQAFVFAALSCIYLNEVVNLGHGH